MAPDLRALALALLLAAPAAAQGLDVPIRLAPDDGQAAVCGSSTVAGLDPNGDGFLAVRSGPGTDFAKIGELREGDTVYACDARGPWIGIYLTDPRGGRPSGLGGWVHGRWLKPLAG